MLFVLFFACTVMFYFLYQIHPDFYPSSTCRKVFLKNRYRLSKKEKRKRKKKERIVPEFGFNSKSLTHALPAICRHNSTKTMINLFSLICSSSPCCLPRTCHIYRCSSVPVSWVRWKSSVMSVSARSCPGCKPGLVVTCPVGASRNCRSSASPSRSSSAICASTCSSAPGPGTNCGRRSSLCSTSAALRTRLP